MRQGPHWRYVSAMAGETTYTVQPGDTLWEIAANCYGDENLYTLILDGNPELKGDPDNVIPGQRLKIPSPA